MESEAGATHRSRRDNQIDAVTASRSGTHFICQDGLQRTLTLEDPLVGYLYYREKGRTAAVLGRSADSYRCFKRAIEFGNKLGKDAFSGNVWLAYAGSAWQLGNINLARKCLETYILVVRESQIEWNLAVAYLEYARLLNTVGQYAEAREHLLKADSYSRGHTVSQVYASIIGLSLATALNDSELLVRFDQPEFIEYAFKDGNPTVIGGIAAVFASLYAARGRANLAGSLLHRALKYGKRPLKAVLADKMGA